jgi:hypothetical protein
MPQPIYAFSEGAQLVDVAGNCVVLVVKYIANKLVETHCTDIVVGHVHTASSFTKVAAAGKRKWTGWTLPTMGTVNPSFTRSRPNGHTHGVGLIELIGDQFNLYTIGTDPITGCFAYGGKVYGSVAKRSRHKAAEAGNRCYLIPSFADGVPAPRTPNNGEAPGWLPGAFLRLVIDTENPYSSPVCARPAQ